MKDSKLPETDSITKLAEFWDTHDLSDFADELEEVEENIFQANKQIVSLELTDMEMHRLQQIMAQTGQSQSELLKTWITPHLNENSSE